VGDVPVGEFGWIPLLTGIAVTDALRSVAEVDAVLKWPNDILIGDKKVAGILAELVTQPSGAGVVLGLGLNVALDDDELPVPTATSLRLAGAATTDRQVLLHAYLRALEHRYARWHAAAGDPRRSGVGAAYREACTTLGREVVVQLPTGEDLTGTAEGVDDEGRLLVRDAAGAERALAAGDVRHVR
jgi:BirA family biotin operon repressor/biotin-[acetyl-CoA-carboxylase] ligase